MACGSCTSWPCLHIQSAGLSKTASLCLLQVFLHCIQLFLDTRASEIGATVFDKDDALAVEFVTAASNLRSQAFRIPTQSLFDTKVALVPA